MTVHKELILNEEIDLIFSCVFMSVYVYSNKYTYNIIDECFLPAGLVFYFLVGFWQTQ